MFFEFLFLFHLLFFLLKLFCLMEILSYEEVPVSYNLAILLEEIYCNLYLESGILWKVHQLKILKHFEKIILIYI